MTRINGRRYISLIGFRYRHRFYDACEEYADTILPKFFRWQELEEEIANYPEFHRNDFTVIILPTLKHAKIPLARDGFADLSYLSADCFHLSQKSNAICKYNGGICVIPCLLY